jgi:cytoskeleton protein RodZ
MSSRATFAHARLTPSPTSNCCYTELLRAQGMAKGNFGERLKRERELREVTLEEITAATRIAPRFLDALENEDWVKLPGGVFNRGFVRSIARYLGLNEEALLGEYDMAHGVQVPSAEEQVEPKESIPNRWQPAAIILGVLVLLGALVVGGVRLWKHWGSRHAAKQTTAASAALPAIPQPVPSLIPASVEVPATTSNATNSTGSPLTPVSASLDLRITVKSDTHLLVGADDRVVFYEQVHAGQSPQFASSQGFEVTAANTGAVLLELNGQAMPALGAPGTFGTIKLNHDSLRQASGGNP